ncbi:MAG: sigma 54-interacting transcriptional regulator, partial [Syntrophobacteraceae bacterium]
MIVPRSLKSKLLAGVSALVICSGFMISLLVTHIYSRGLSESMSAQARYLTHAVALQAADLVLINDSVSLQKLLDHLMRSNPSLSYLFIVRDGQVLAHTFDAGIPMELLDANEVLPSEESRFREIVSTNGDYFLDVAAPIFEGKAGTLRLGFSEEPYRRQIAGLWLRMSLITLGILLLGLLASLLFIRRITEPLSDLAQAADKVNRGELDIRVSIRGRDEVANVAASFNTMVSSVQAHTSRLEQQTVELKRAHQQTRTFCGIVQEIGAIDNLKDMGKCLIGKFETIVECSGMALLVVNDAHDTLYVMTENSAIDLREPDSVQNINLMLRGLENFGKQTLQAGLSSAVPMMSELFQTAALHSVLPLSRNDRSFGALIITCSGDCHCYDEEIGLISLMLAQAVGVIRRAMLREEEIRDLQTRIHAPVEFCGIVSKNPKMQSIFNLIEDIAPTDASVLIQGESGTGKELVARAIHRKSHRKDKPFVVIDCAAYPATLLESELFGHEKGAFTGAIRQKAGRFEQADGGTVFLDEIGEIPLPAQIKLLRVLQTQKFERVGGEQTLTVDVRIISATNRNLLVEVQQAQFREDLYYRLKVIPIHLPPLRDRRNDIPL